jgi:hypothetical protein
MIFALMVFAPISAFSNEEMDKVTRDGISAIRNTKTKEAAQIALKEAVNKLSAIAEKLGIKTDQVKKEAETASKKIYSANDIADLKKKAKDAKDIEQSKENKMLGGITMAATGIGGMQLAQGLAEMKADNEADADMDAYLKTVWCGIGGMRTVEHETSGTTPEETRQLVDARLKYAGLAQKMKTAKENLGMAPGIESELVIDTSALYQGRGTDTDGIVHHFDTAEKRKESEEGKKRAIGGGIAAGAGVLVGIGGDAIINDGGPLGGISKAIKGKVAEDKVEKEEKKKEKEEQQKREAMEKKQLQSRLPSSVVVEIFRRARSSFNAETICDELEGNRHFMQLPENEKLAYVKGQEFYEKYKNDGVDK